MTRVNEEVRRTDHECKERIEGVVRRLEAHTSNDLHRTEKIWEEVQKSSKEVRESESCPQSYIPLLYTLYPKP